MSSRYVIPVGAMLLLGLMVGGYLVESRSQEEAANKSGLDLSAVERAEASGRFSDWPPPNDRHFEAALKLQTPTEEQKDVYDLYRVHDELGVSFPPELIAGLRHNVEADQAFYELLEYALSDGARSLTYPTDQLRELRRTVDTDNLNNSGYRLRDAALLAVADNKPRQVTRYLRMWMTLLYAHTQNPSAIELLYLTRGVAQFSDGLSAVLSRIELSEADLREISAWAELFPIASHQVRCMQAAVDIAQWRLDNITVVNAYQFAESRLIQIAIREDDDPDLTPADRRQMRRFAGQLVPEEHDQEGLRSQLHAYQSALKLLQLDKDVRLQKLAELYELDSEDNEIVIQRSFVRVALNARALLNMVRGLIRCELYRLEHGDWPEATDTFIQTLPIDPWSLKPLGYQHTEHGVMVYTIGTNQIDDQGRGQDHWNRDEPDREFDDYRLELLDPELRNKMPSPEKEY